MTRDQLLRVAPELYAALLEEGIKLERERVLAHLDIADMYRAALKAAVEAVRQGVLVCDPEALHDVYCEVEDRYDALEDAYDSNRSPSVIAKKEEQYKQACRDAGCSSTFEQRPSENETSNIRKGTVDHTPGGRHFDSGARPSNIKRGIKLR